MKNEAPATSSGAAVLQNGIATLIKSVGKDPTTTIGAVLVAAGAFMLGQESEKQRFRRLAEQMRNKPPTPIDREEP